MPSFVIILVILTLFHHYNAFFMHQSMQRAPSVSNCVQYEYVWLVRVLLYGGAEYCVLVEGGVGKVHLCHPSHCAKFLRPVALWLLKGTDHAP